MTSLTAVMKYLKKQRKEERIVLLLESGGCRLTAGKVWGRQQPGGGKTRILTHTFVLWAMNLVLGWLVCHLIQAGTTWD